MYPPPPPAAYRLRRPHPLSRAFSLLFGVGAAALVGFVVAVRTGSTPLAAAAGAAMLALALVGLIGPSPLAARTIASGLLVAMVAAAWWLVAQWVTLARVLDFTEGSADPADPVALAAAEDKLDLFDRDGSFRIELTEGEIEAVIQQGLSAAESPLLRVAIDIVDGAPGELRFVGTFKKDAMQVSGTVTAVVVAGSVHLEVGDIDVGDLTVPDLAEDAIEDLMASIADLDTILDENRADVQAIVLGDDRLLVTGTQGGGSLLTSADLLADLAARASAATDAVQPPPERLGPGRTAGPAVAGSPVYVALGDSLAAGVGVDDLRDGYVSRLHRALEERDGTTYGLRNFGVPGETSGTLIRGGQLDAATAFMAAAEIRYVTIDIGANDLLGHLGSDDCSAGLDAPACADRIDRTFTAYATNLVTIFDRLREAAPGATIVFLRAYNPFSLGFAPVVAFEVESDAILDAFNDVAAELAVARGIVVADGFTPLQGTTAATTHMLDAPPDIHPRAIGHDALAAAILDALG